MGRWVVPGKRDPVAAREPGERGLGRMLWGSGALVAVATAVLYFVGSLHLGAFYGTLGLTDTQAHFDVPYVLANSVLPLLPPVFFLALVAVFFPSFPPHSSRGLRAPFYPVPAVTVVTWILGLWFLKLFMDVAYPTTGDRWLLYRPRDVVLFATGAVALLLVYRHHHRLHTGKPPVFPLSSSMLAWLLAAIWVAALIIVVFGGGWPLPAFQTVLISLATVYAAVMMYWNWSKTKRKPHQGPAQRKNSTRIARESGGGVVLAALLAVFLLLLAAAFSGTVAGKAQLDGCSAYKTVSFHPMPDGLEDNSTYWLVLHHGDFYYVREIELDRPGPVLAVPEQPAMIATFKSSPATRAC